MTDDTPVQQYTDEFIEKLEINFGEGFLSADGAEEVTKIVEGIDLQGKEVLDIGVGVGGPACVLVENHGALRVTGIDVAEPVLRKAAATVSNRGLQDRILLEHVTPGPLPFDAASFDVAFSKDSIIHVPDKQALFKEVYRVLRPRGWLVMSDWYRSEEPFTEEMLQWGEATGFTSAMTTMHHDGSLLTEVGFVDLAIIDRNDWFTEYNRAVVESWRGPKYDTMVAKLGREYAEERRAVAERRYVVSAQGQLRPGHLRGRKPM